MTTETRGKHGVTSLLGRVGSLGAVAIVGLGAAVVVTVVTGFAITTTVRNHLLDARSDLIASEVANLPSSDEFGSFADAVSRELHGGEIRQVKVWDDDGTIAHSNDPSLIGKEFDLLPPAVEAFNGSVATQISTLDDPSHETQLMHGELIEIYVPVFDESGGVPYVVEVEQGLDSLNSAMSDVATSVWLAIGFGIGVLAVFLAALALSVLRASQRRIAQSERLLGATYRAQEAERRRIVGSLHDDVGQPLYRLLYGLEGSRARLPNDHPVSSELEHLGSVARDIDTTLRSELNTLTSELAADAGLLVALANLVEVTDVESGMHVSMNAPLEPQGVTDVGKIALYRAAQEAVVNARKHSGAETLTINVNSGPARVSITVEDDGHGGTIEPGLGISTTRERLDALGGGLTVKSSARGGTKVTAWLPADRSLG